MKKQQVTSAFDDGRTTIIFRNLGTDLPPEYMPGWNWQVELHNERGFPIGIAWVLALPPGLTKAPPGYVGTPYLKFIVVIDDMRRQGIGTRLIEACQRRWPDINLGLPISEAGEALLDKFSPARLLDDDEEEDGTAEQKVAGEGRDGHKPLIAERGASLPSKGNDRPKGKQPDAKGHTAGSKKGRNRAARKRRR